MVKPLDRHGRGIQASAVDKGRAGVDGAGQTAETSVPGASADVRRPDLAGRMTRGQRLVTPAERHAARAGVPLCIPATGKPKPETHPVCETKPIAAVEHAH